MSRTTFRIKALPTLLSGAVADTQENLVEGLTVSLPELDATTRTDANGNFAFRFDKAKNVDSGRYRLVVNPGMKDPRYGTLEAWAVIRNGGANTLNALLLPLLNPEIPFEQLSSGQNSAVLARGNLTLDLTNAQLLFPDGRNRGRVHIQFLTTSQIAFQAMDNVTPSWLYNVQPSGIAVRGDIGVTLQLPKLYGSFDYLPPDGTLVAMLGFDPELKVVSVVGVGQVNAQQQVVSLGKLPMAALDYVGFAFVPEQAYALLERYQAGEIATLEELQGLIAGTGQ